MPSTSKTFAWMSGSWILTLPEPNSEPLSTRSYAIERTDIGSDSNLSMSSGWGPTAVLGGFEGGEVDHKQRRQLLVAVGTAELDPELAEYGCHRPPVVGGEQQHVARFAVEGGDHSGSFLLGQELGHR